MASSAFPSVIAAVVSMAELAVSPTRVVRGRDISNEAGDVVMVGVQNPETSGWDSPGSFEQTMQTFGGNREEVGTVNVLILAYNGDADQDAALDTALGYLAVIEAALRADKTLGLGTFDYVVAEMRRGDPEESQNEMGATTALPFAIDYKIRI